MKRMKDSSFIQKVIDHPIGAGVITAAIIGIGTKLLGWWPTIWNAVWFAAGQTFAWLGSKSEVWNWLLLLMAGCTLAIATMVVRKSRQQSKVKDTVVKPIPEWSKYRCDSFLGVIWFWSYDENWNVVRLECRCPKCLYQIVPSAEHRLSYRYGGTQFHCDPCKRTYESETQFKQLDSTIHRHIEQKQTMGTWRTVVESMEKADELDKKGIANNDAQSPTLR